MKFKINREQFLKGLSIASRPTQAKSPIPILGNILLSLDETGLTLLGSSNELAIRTHIPMRVNDLEVIRMFLPGETLISSKTLNESIRKMEGNEIDVEIIDRTIAQISDGRTEYRLGAIDSKDYPDIDLSQDGTVFEIGAKDFIKLVDQTSFAASVREQRPILTALNLNAVNGTLTAVATDSARLANKVVTLKDNVSFVANVPARIMNEVAKLLETMVGIETIEVSASANKINFMFDDTLVVSRLVAGEYPPTRSIIPKTHASFLEANANELLKAMDRVSILYAAEKDNIVKLSLSPESVVVSARSTFSAESAREEVALCKYVGEPLEISFNYTLVSSAIKATGAEDVTIGFNGGHKPFSIRVATDDSLVLIVTPVRT
ncbi:MAG: DNA polymerase III subunit beta [Bacilli bacterium]|jgi:DNA polymerase-3 subunit beta|nr:DNA polymerase III subunit beta [Bacillota bacterium]NLI52450.1 DNA polymerase III subunit beta [Erysipelotrichaceae bacterium]OQC50336.1 MAG: DNA polymerase III subunit beta [Tenericutes bacterium ADurb.Bin024]HOA10890.1 DNA polymerase III subunit beta [Bacilli bacterium]TAH58999.1 MAG: DNA polymerase III subunit beta [Bacillota bacterium]